MVWRLRHDMDCITAPMLIPELKKMFDVVDPRVIKNQIDVALFLSHFIHVKEAEDDKYVLPECPHLQTGLASNLKTYAENLGIDIPEKIDSKLYISITKNKLINLGSEVRNDELRNRLSEFSEKIKNIQHYFFHSKCITVARLLGKLLTRIWWIYHTSSPLMKSMKTFENGPGLEVVDDEDDEEEELMYESSSDEEEDEDDEGEDDDEEYEEEDDNEEESTVATEEETGSVESED